MRAITLMQPYATLLIKGIKHHETRSWPLPSTVGGLRVLVHAGKEWHPDFPRDVAAMDFHDLVLDRHCIGIGGRDYRRTMPTSAILGSLIFKDCGQVSPSGDLPFSMTAYQLSFGDYSALRWVWRCVERIEFAVPIVPVRGKQGVWTYEGELP